MKLVELQELLGKEVTKLSEEKELTSFDIERANAISTMSRQMINNAKVILMAEKPKDKHGIVE